MQNPRLFDSDINAYLVRLFDIAFYKALGGGSPHFIYNIDVYLDNSSFASQYYHGVGQKLIADGVREFGWKVTPEKLQKLGEKYVTTFGMLSSAVFVGVDVTKPGFPAALYTRRLDLLPDALVANSSQQEVAALQEALVGAKTVNGFDKGDFFMLRLDVANVINRVPVFEVTIPRSRLKIGVGQDFVFIPVKFMYRATDILLARFANRPFRFTKTSEIGSVSHIAAFSPDVVRHVYKTSKPADVESKLQKTVCGYDIARLRVLGYDLESSVDTVGTASFRPEMLDAIKEARVSAINTSQHNVNYATLRAVFKTAVSKFKASDFDAFKVVSTSGFATLAHKAEELVEWSGMVDGPDLFNIMNQYSDLFGDVNEALVKRERLLPKAIKQLQPVAIPDDAGARKKLLKGCLANGVVRLTMVSSTKNTVSQRICSNNTAFLERMLGKEYVATFESLRVRLEAVKERIVSGKITSLTQLEKEASDYGVLGHVNSVMLLNKAFNKSDTSSSIAALDEAIGALVGSKQRSEDLVVFRNVYADNERNFYGSVNVHNIIAIDYAEYEEKT